MLRPIKSGKSSESDDANPWPNSGSEIREERRTWLGRLDGKVAIITGGARGQGASEVELFAREGAKVVFGDLREELGHNVEAQVNSGGGDATFITMDVSVSEDWRRAVGLAESKYGKLDILVNNAGITGVPFLETTTLEQWNEVIAVNAKSVFLGTKHSIPAMRRVNGGAIVNVGSISGFVGVGYTAYAASKGALRAFTKVVAIQHAKEQIRCNSIHVGPIDTPMRQEAQKDPAAKGRPTLPNVPLGRIGKPEDIAYSVLYLASDEASFVTGAEFVIDGGVTIQ